MPNVRIYGNKPFQVAVLHGGPGAPGEIAPVARQLSTVRGILEPLQVAPSLRGQVTEIKAILAEYASSPVILVGWSWGALLGFLFTSKYPSLVTKLILISSGVFAEEYALEITKTRLNRLDKADKTEAISLLQKLDNPVVRGKDDLMFRLGKLFSKADYYDPLPHEAELWQCQWNVYREVWSQFLKLRRSGKLLEMGRNIQCPVVAIHGDYDPHPFNGIKEPLAGILRDFRFILLPNCGHYPWIEKSAREAFFNILKHEIE
jgi:pimeloyl-ACP methyl ester carboxylesterase